HLVTEGLHPAAEVDPTAEAPPALGERGLPGDLEVLERPVLGGDLSEHLRRLLRRAARVADPNPGEPVSILSRPVDLPPGLSQVIDRQHRVEIPTNPLDRISVQRHHDLDNPRPILRKGDVEVNLHPTPRDKQENPKNSNEPTTSRASAPKRAP